MKPSLRRLAGLLACLLLLTTVAGSSITYAAGDPIYLFINDDLIDNMSGSVMPIRVNNSLYISYRYLSRIKPIKYLYNETDRILRVYDGERTLIFDLSSGITYDENRRIYSYLAEIRGGVLFIPIEFICRYFGVEYEQFICDYGPIIRINTNLSRYSNDELIKAHRGALQIIYDAYHLNDEPSAPVVKPPVVPDVTPDDPRTPRTLYPMLCGPINENTAGILSALDTYHTKITFFVTADGLREHSDVLRRTVCSGHPLGLSVSAADPLSEAEAINELLSALIFRRSRLVCVQEGSDALTAEQQQALTDAGYRLWDGMITPNSDTADGYAVSTRASSQLRNAAAVSSMALSPSAGTREGLYTILRYLRDNSFTTLPIEDWTTPLNRARNYN